MSRSSKFTAHVRSLLALPAAVLLLACVVYADDITIKDTAGYTRASSTIGQQSDIQFDVIDSSGAPADGVVITLTDSAGTELTATAVGGVVIFEGVGAGIYTVASAVPGITFTNVTIAEGLAAALAASSGVAAGSAALTSGLSSAAIGTAAAGVAVAGAATVAITEASDDSDDGKPLSPST